MNVMEDLVSGIIQYGERIILKSGIWSVTELVLQIIYVGDLVHYVPLCVSTKALIYIIHATEGDYQVLLSTTFFWK